MEKLKNVFRSDRNNGDDHDNDNDTPDQSGQTHTSQLPLRQPAATTSDTPPQSTGYLPPVPTSEGLFDSTSPQDPNALAATTSIQDTEITPSQRTVDDKSDLSMKSGVEGPKATGTDSGRLESESSKSDYTGITPGQNLADRIAERERIAAEEKELERDHYSTSHHAPGAVAGTGAATVLGGDALGSSAHESGPPRDQDVDNATYTDRKFTVGGTTSSTDSTDPTALSGNLFPSRPELTSTLSMPHVPGEFPLDNGEDPHRSGLVGSTDAGASSTEHHTGRDAAVGVGSGAAAAAAAYAAYENTRQPSTGVAQTQAPTEHTATSTTTSAQPQEHHYGRDAAIVGGAGAVGAGGYAAYEANQDRNQPLAQQGQTQQTTRDAAPVHTSTTTTTTTAATQPSKPTEAEEKHYGRDAAVVGGAGAAGAGGYAAYEGIQDRNTSHLADVDQPETPPVGVHAYVQEPVTGPAASHTETTALASRQPPYESQDEHHYGRDAAIVGGVGAAGAGGYGLYEANKSSDGSPLPSQAAHTSQPAPAEGNDASEEHHYGRDAAIAGGAVGATGLGAAGVYEAEKQHRDASSATQAAGGSPTQTPTKSSKRRNTLTKNPPQKYQQQQQKQQQQQQQYQQREPSPPRQQQTPPQRYEEPSPQRSREQARESSEHRSYGDENTHPTGPLETAHNNKVIVDSTGRNRLHKKAVEVPIERTGSGEGTGDRYSDDYHREEPSPRAHDSEKKPGLLSKILHPSRHKRDTEEGEEEGSRRSLEGTAEER